jgi:hypothetical protein
MHSITAALSYAEHTIRALRKKSVAMLELERGELLLLDPSAEARGEADAAFKHAIDIAIDQSAKTLELRASVARARLCARRVKLAKHSTRFRLGPPVQKENGRLRVARKFRASGLSPNRKLSWS